MEENKKGVKQKNTLSKEEMHEQGEERYQKIIDDPRVSPIICSSDGKPYFVKARNDIMRYICQMENAQAAYLYLILLSHRNSKTNLCIPSNELLAKECNLTVRSVSRIIKSLSDLGAISVNSGKQNVCSNYYFPFEEFFSDFAEDAGQRSAYKRTSAKFKRKEGNKKEECEGYEEQGCDEEDLDFPY